MRQPIFFLLSGLVLYVLGGTAIVPFHADEADHLFRSQDYVAYFVLHDPFRLRVDPPVAIDSEAHIRLLTGTTSAYLTGLMLWQTGVREWPAAWYYPDGVETNRQAGRWPEKSVLWRGRLPSAFLTAACVFLIYKLGRKLKNERTGLFAVILFALHPVILLNGRRVMQEGALLFFTLLLVCLAIRSVEKEGGRRTRMKSPLLAETHGASLTSAPTVRGNWFLLGAIMGLAFASKPTAVFVTISVVVGIILLRRSMRGVVLSLLIAGIVYLLLTPALWNNPPARLLLAARLRQEVLQGQAAASEDAYPHLSERITAFQPYPDRIQYFESSDFADDKSLLLEIQHYEKSRWRGVKLPGWIGAGLAFAGIISILKGFLYKTDGIYAVPTTSIIFATWAIFTFIGLLLTVPMAWQRYYLPWLPIVILLMGTGLDFFIESVQAIWRFYGRG